MTLPTMGPATGSALGERIAESRRRHADTLEMGGPQAVDRHRASGRLPVRERIALLLDEGSWFETGALAQPERRTGKKVRGDGVVTGFGRVDGRTVGLIGIDATVLAGTTAPVRMRKQGRLIEQAQRSATRWCCCATLMAGASPTSWAGGSAGCHWTSRRSSSRARASRRCRAPRRCSRSTPSPRSCPTCRPAPPAPRRRRPPPRWCPRSASCYARPTAAGTSPWAAGPPIRTSCSRGRRPRWASWRRRRGSAPCTGAG